jgi:hypothetical protein
LIDKRFVEPAVDMGAGESVPVAWPAELLDSPAPIVAEQTRETGALQAAELTVPDSTVLAPLGTIIGTRSGDKAGSANLGAWARDEQTFCWLTEFLTVERLHALMPELDGLRVERHLFSNLKGMNFLIYQYLGDGVSACTRIDPQAKGLGEYLGSRLAEIPADLLPAESRV